MGGFEPKAKKLWSFFAFSPCHVFTSPSGLCVITSPGSSSGRQNVGVRRAQIFPTCMENLLRMFNYIYTCLSSDVTQLKNALDGVSCSFVVVTCRTCC